MFDRKSKNLECCAYVVVAVIVIGICSAASAFSARERVVHLDDLDPDLENAINEATPELAKSLKRRFTNAGISEAIRTNDEPSAPSIAFADIFVRDGSNNITLKNLAIQTHPRVRLNDINPNLFERNLRVTADWYNIVIEGSYELTNSSQLQILPVRNLGDIKILIENVSTNGLIGFKTFKDAFKTTNYDLEFNAENITVEIEYYDQESKTLAKSIQKFKKIDSSIAKYIKRDLYWRLKENLRERLDYVLLDFSLPEVFNDNYEISEKYVTRNSFFDQFINDIVDQFISDVQKGLIAKGYEKIAIADFQTDFSHTFGFLTFWGHFNAQNGTVQDLSKIKRTGQFSLAKVANSSKVQIFGSLGLDEFILRYNYYNARVWNIGPWGEIEAKIGDNSINFKLIAEVKKSLGSESGMALDFRDFDIKVDRLDDIKVKATGLSVVLNWLLSYIGTWITGYLKKDIIAQVETRLKTLVIELLPKIKL